MVKQSKWISIKILSALKQEIDEHCKNQNNGFVNASQYIHHILRNDLDSRKEKR